MVLEINSLNQQFQFWEIRFPPRETRGSLTSGMAALRERLAARRLAKEQACASSPDPDDEACTNRNGRSLVLHGP